MAKSIKSIDEVNIPKTYELQKAEFVKEIDSFALTLRHKVSGARVLIFSNEDDNKVFSINFRTPPKDCTGVPHIIEHTVLCGSKNFPAKDPFVELVKGSLNTFLNAMTYPDKTMYPVASRNDKDFKNLMHVYMDAVLYPNIYEHEEIFKQEGWHYELEDADAPLKYNGVVYNEMKGVFSSSDSVLEYFLLHSMFPDNTYGQESGGEPKYIPDLTYEDYLEFHRKYYHPVNSYIYLYGDMDIEERLNWMDENYLKDFPAIDIDSHIIKQKPFDKMKSLEKYYAVAEDEDCTQKTYYAFGSVIDKEEGQEVCRAMGLLSYCLVEMPGAPLKQALLDAGIGTDIDVDFDDSMCQCTFSIVTKNAEAGKKDEFYRVIRETLEGIIKDGVDGKDLEAAINGMEFREKEMDFGSTPKGLTFDIKAMKSWLYNDEQPYEALRYEKFYEFLRKKLGTGYYEELIQKYILDNPHSVLVEMKPKPGLTLSEEKELEEKLAAYKAGLDDSQIEKLIADTKALKAYQEEPTPKELLEKIPMLSRSDISKDVLPYSNKEMDISGVKTVWHDVETNDIVYLSLFFDAEKFEEYMPQMSFLTTLLGYMDTEQRSYREFDTETNFYTGGIVSDVVMHSHYKKIDEYDIKLEVRVKVLRSKLKDALRLLAEMLFETKFDDEKHLQEVVAESRSRLRMQLMSSGHQAAAIHACAGLRKSSWLNDAAVGVKYYEYLTQLDENFDSEKQKLVSGCQALLGGLLNRAGMMVSCTGNKQDIKELEKCLPEFLDKLDSFMKKSSGGSPVNTIKEKLQPFKPVSGKELTAFTTPAEIQYVALAGTFDSLKNVKTGVLFVVKQLLRYDYLWNEVRVKGGAYGVGCQFNRECEGYFTSYRDPNLKRTVDVYRGVADYLSGYEAEEREITKTVIGTISELDTPLTPAMKGRRSMNAYFTNVPIEVLEEERKQVLECSLEDIRQAAEVMKAIFADTNLCVIGNEKHIKEEGDLFEIVKPLS